MIFEELSLPYDWTVLEFDQVKTETYLAVNPNGRLPTIEDPNTGVTLWEVRQSSTAMGLMALNSLTSSQSGAIIQYLIQQYDNEAKLSYSESPNKYLCQQWLAFQTSGKLLLYLVVTS